MRLSPFICFLLLTILFHEAQGIRLKKESLSSTDQKSHHEGANMVRRKNGGPLCRNEHCSGRNRNLMTKMYSKSSTTTTSKSDKHEANKADTKEENFSVNSTSPQSYPDIVDIAGMDYSPARRKPPIHN